MAASPIQSAWPTLPASLRLRKRVRRFAADEDGSLIIFSVYMLVIILMVAGIDLLYLTVFDKLWAMEAGDAPALLDRLRWQLAAAGPAGGRGDGHGVPGAGRGDEYAQGIGAVRFVPEELDAFLGGDSAVAVPCTSDGTTGRLVKVEATIVIAVENWMFLMEQATLSDAIDYLFRNANTSRVTFTSGCPVVE